MRGALIFYVMRALWYNKNMDNVNRYNVLSMLLAAKGRFVSGEDISGRLGVSRTAVWKYINELRDMGYIIESHSRSGYRLDGCPDVLWPDEIKYGLDTSAIGCEIIHFDSIGSTNDKAKEIAASGCSDGLVVVAEEQTGGRGRLGRQWVSPPRRGIWMSIVLHPVMQPVEAQRLTLLAALAVSRAIEHCTGLDVHIKWPNDIIISDKKACGILTEMSAEMDRINYVIIGIGINVNICREDMPEGIRPIATSLAEEVGHEIDRKALLRAVLQQMDELYAHFTELDYWYQMMDEYRKRCINMGRRAVVASAGKAWEGDVIDIDDSGALIVLASDGSQQRVISGDVSIRGVEGYV